MTDQDDILAELPEFFETHPQSDNYDLVYPIGNQTINLTNRINELEAALRLQHAETIDQLQRHAALVDLPPEENESVEHYRARLIAEFQLVTAEGTIDDVLTGASVILNTDKRRLSYTEQTTPNGDAVLGIPNSDIESTPLSGQELAAILERLLASSYELQVNIKGSFTYVTPTDYNNGAMDASRGYDGLDANGNPKDNGGTYAGTLN